MQDRELVAAIVAGDPVGLAEAYDRYAAPLYTYCRFMLPDPDPMGDAASVVQDTFLIATSKLEGLRDPDKLRPWLHAVARNECLRRLGAGPASRRAGKADPGAMPEVALPAALREQVLKACADDTPAGRAYRVSVAHRAGPFGWSGFPQPLVPTGPRWWYQVRRHPRVAAAVAVLALAVVAGGVAVMLTAGGSPGSRSTIALGSGSPGTTSAPASGPASSPAGARSSPSHKAAALAKVTPTTPGAGPTTSQPTTGAPTPTHPAPSSSSPSRSPSPSPSPSPSLSPSPSPSPSPTQGILWVEPNELVLTEVKGKATSGTFDLIALGGPVRWVLHLPASVTASPTSGYLLMGGDFVVVTVTVKSLVSLTAQLIADPGGVIVTIVLTVTK